MALIKFFPYNQAEWVTIYKILNTDNPRRTTQSRATRIGAKKITYLVPWSGVYIIK